MRAAGRPGERRGFALARRATALVFLALIVLAARAGLPGLRGSAVAGEALGRITFVDPLAALETLLASRAVLPAVVIGAAVPVAIALLLGPVFCAWLCPLGLLLDLAQVPSSALRRRLAGRGGERPERRLDRRAKLVLLAGLLAFALVARVPLFSLVSPIQSLTRAAVLAADATLGVVAALLVLEVFLPRTWCRALCPAGALLGVIGGRGLLRVRADAARGGGTGCRRCEAACPMGIAVMDVLAASGRGGIDHGDCTRCGACVDACPRGDLALGLRRRPGGRSARPEASVCGSCPQ